MSLPVCTICGQLVESKDDLAQLFRMTAHFEHVNKPEFEPGMSAHIFPEGKCPGTPWVARHLTDQPLADGEEYHQYLADILRPAYRELTSSMFTCRPPEMFEDVPIYDENSYQQLVGDVLGFAGMVIKSHQDGVIQLGKSQYVVDGILYIPYLGKYFALYPTAEDVLISDTIGGSTRPYEDGRSILEVLRATLIACVLKS